MKIYKCNVCKWVYNPAKGDPEHDITPGTPFKDLPDNWKCPVCGYGKDEFEEVETGYDNDKDDKDDDD